MILILTIFVFLFSLYVLSKDDFVFLRKNVSQNTIFDLAFLSGIVALFFARLVWVAAHFSPLYLNPLVFFVIPYFPGLSLAGTLLGGGITLYLLALRQKLPMGRVFDIFSFALLLSLVVAFMGYAVLLTLQKNYVLLGTYTTLAILLSATYVWLHALFLRSSWKDGNVGMLVLTILTIMTMLGQEMSVQFKTLAAELPYFTVFLLILLFIAVIRRVRKGGERE